jgi:hypothetical protein
MFAFRLEEKATVSTRDGEENSHSGRMLAFRSSAYLKTVVQNVEMRNRRRKRRSRDESTEFGSKPYDHIYKYRQETRGLLAALHRLHHRFLAVRRDPLVSVAVVRKKVSFKEEEKDENDEEEKDKTTKETHRKPGWCWPRAVISASVLPSRRWSSRPASLALFSLTCHHQRNAARKNMRVEVTRLVTLPGR